ncbi:N-acetylglucosamine-6-phosphate deacetylase [Cellvibrio zantedeschiae]|uniref:N-acetylglucosamine-6-phosphate deacetylase n=1 Tax=Cellvibrio zantedeschiae TaxID=1237077 RepID=A0ABQ3AN35_9GAMM|nr:N-acetylglucosamine-6-phosphate deacetylase [Cellvibrio zantedeschiae]GGY62485.1 N-acetylglucosamine-6-phosphate deacetylase [Cellvibrio zantedeschiae]
MTIALVNGLIFTGNTWLTNQAVIIDAEEIVAICDINNLPAVVNEKIDLQGQRLIPGLIDTQVNGGGGALFNDAPTVETIRAIGQAHRQFGTTGFYPTLISDDLSVVAKAIEAVNQAIAEKVPGVLGIHLEGPFLNPERKGVHDASKFKIIDEAAFELLTSLKVGKTLITIAPELTTPEMIKRFVNAGVVVAAGHSAANYAQTKTALAAGVSSFTHLFNAMTPFTSREPGMVGAILEDKNSWCGIIVDGFHVHPASLKVAHQAKAPGKMVLVTDAMPSVGATDKNFMLNGELIQCKDGKLSTATGTLAGSDLDMLAAVKNTVEMVGIDLDEAIRMASQYPAAMMGENSLGAIKVGYKASMILIDDNFKLVRSWINGSEV